MVEKTYTPKTLSEALDIIRNNEVTLFAGGTDLMVTHLISSETIIKFNAPPLHLNKIDELKTIKKCEDKLIIGSLATFSDIIKNEYTPRVLKECSGAIAGPPIRNIATIGGNICNASPSADSLPSLYAMNALLKLQSKTGMRIVPISEFITGVSKTIIKKNEILTEIIIPLEKYEHSFYRKIGTRKANALSKLAICALALKENDKYTFRISFCTLGRTITRDVNIENNFLTDDMSSWKNKVDMIKASYDEIINPRDSARSTALYRRKCALNLIGYFFSDIIK